MADSHSVLTDNSRLSRIDQFVFRLESALTLVGGITIFLLVLLAVINALGRWLFNHPVSGYVDWVEQFMAIFAFAGIAYCQREGGHIRMDILLRQMHGRAQWLAEWVSTFFMLLITGVLIFGSWLHFWRAFNNGDSSMDIGLPIWPAKLIVPFALVMLAVRLIIQLWAYSRALYQGSYAPVAIPLIEDPAIQAKNEASTVDNDEKEDSQ
jgi:C4-dicarboxylate transporter, DctQ subunit